MIKDIHQSRRSIPMRAEGFGNGVLREGFGNGISKEGFGNG
jgi:hypothetical protein